ncbi:RidA family protein [Paraburkholderia tropica]|uniref:RidA family protein n=1 Tax=Paraburkholderia tropica TaxID=92647 RepID=UPI0030189224
MSILTRLEEMGYELPPAPKPAASYTTVVREASFVFVSGQGPMVGPDPVITGRVGGTVTEQQAYEAARLAVLNALAALHADVGLDSLSHIVKLTGWVSSAENFYRQHVVVDGASDLLIALFGDSGLHTRCAVGVSVLPFNIPVEIELTVALR